MFIHTSAYRGAAGRNRKPKELQRRRHISKALSRLALILALGAGLVVVPTGLGLGANAADAVTSGLVWPADGVVTQNAAEHLYNEGARAIDIAKSGPGIPVVAAAAGSVITASVGGNTQCYRDNHASNGLGNYVVIKHSDSGGTSYTTYAHLASEEVSVGAVVSQAQQIGVMGYTGCVMPTGPGGQHLHFAVSSCSNEFICSEWNDPDVADETAISRGTAIPNSNYAGTGGATPPPDQDGDGVPDASDACPTVQGIPANRGCPPSGDLNGDGKSDLYMAERATNGTVNYFYGLSHGDGHFDYGTAAGLSGLPTPIAIASGDLNGDGKSDLYMAERATNGTVNYFYGLSHGDGHFDYGTAAGLSGLPTPIAIASGDLNGDGKSDLYMAERATNGTVNYFYGLSHGDGHFDYGTAAGLSGLPTPIAIASGDLNGDGKSDLYMAERATNGTVNYFYGLSHGDGHFDYGTAAGLSGLPTPIAIASGDLNGDGKSDLYMAERATNGTVNYFYGLSHGDGHFDYGTAAGLSGLPTPIAIASGDLNGDGKSDLYMAERATNGTVNYFYGLSHGDGHFDYGTAAGLSGLPTPVQLTSSSGQRTYRALKVLTVSIPDGTVGQAFSFKLAASGGVAPLRWSVVSGGLPSGLRLSSGGQILGTPHSAQQTSFVVGVRDTTGLLATKALNMSVNARN